MGWHKRMSRKGQDMGKERVRHGSARPRAGLHSSREPWVDGPLIEIDPVILAPRILNRIVLLYQSLGFVIESRD